MRRRNIRAMGKPRFTNEEIDAIVEALQFYTAGKMSDVGLDPDNDEHVRQWYIAYNAVSKAVSMQKEREHK